MGSGLRELAADSRNVVIILAGRGSRRVQPELAGLVSPVEIES